MQNQIENQETKPEPGFTRFSELLNGRLAMLGFVIGIAVEYFTGKGILEQIGLQ